ncbi:MAG: hypothetical protein ACYCOU_10840 [Sulfobacillus sp.]
MVLVVQSALCFGAQMPIAWATNTRHWTLSGAQQLDPRSGLIRKFIDENSSHTSVLVDVTVRAQEEDDQVHLHQISKSSVLLSVNPGAISQKKVILFRTKVNV